MGPHRTTMQCDGCQNRGKRISPGKTGVGKSTGAAGQADANLHKLIPHKSSWVVGKYIIKPESWARGLGGGEEGG